MMKEYAEWYAKECLKVAAEEAKIVKQHDWENYKDVDETFEDNDFTYRVSKKSILNITLPEHN